MDLAKQDRGQGLNTRELQTLLLTGQAMSQEQDEERICRWIRDAAASLLEASLAAIALAPREHAGPWEVCGEVKDSVLPETMVRDVARLAEMEWPAPQRAGRVAVLSAADLPSGLASQGVSHLVRVDLRTVQQELGVLILGREGPWELGSREQFVLTTLANHAAVALENVRHRRAAIDQAQKLEAVVQASPLAIIARDRDAKVQMWNSAAENTFGWSEGEILGQLYPLVPEDRQEEFRANVERAMRGEALSGLETRRKKKDGTLIDADIWTAPLSDGGAMVVIADITERKRAEESLREMALFMQFNPAPVMRFDGEGRILFANAAAVETLGQKAKEGVQLASLLPGIEGIDLERHIREDLVTIHEDMVGQRHFQFVIRGLSEFGFGHVYGSDIAERKQAEEAQRELAVMEERNRLAQEIHDTLAQGFTAIIWQLNAAERTVENRHYSISRRCATWQGSAYKRPAGRYGTSGPALWEAILWRKPCDRRWRR